VGVAQLLFRGEDGHSETIRVGHVLGRLAREAGGAAHAVRVLRDGRSLVLTRHESDGGGDPLSPGVAVVALLPRAQSPPSAGRSSDSRACCEWLGRQSVTRVGGEAALHRDCAAQRATRRPPPQVH
jgi:hypothetical protein